MKTIKFIACLVLGFLVGMVAYNAKAAEPGLNNRGLQPNAVLGVTPITADLSSALLKGYNSTCELKTGSGPQLQELMKAGSLECLLAPVKVSWLSPMNSSLQTVDSYVIGWYSKNDRFGDQPIYLTFTKSSAPRWAAFRDFILTDKGQEILRIAGFTPIALADRK